MAKGIGLIGNFKGKVGNMVGYKLSDSNTGNSQGIRVYQPIVKNPKTSAQAEQRAKLAPINATYRALKMVIDRGNEGLPYGNKSRLAWLRQAFKAQTMPWFVKGAAIDMPVVCELSRGSLPGIDFSVVDGKPSITVPGMKTDTDISTNGKLSTAMLAGYPNLKVGDQLTFVVLTPSNGSINSEIRSVILDPESTVAQDFLEPRDKGAFYDLGIAACAFAVIVSREGANGVHLRSTTTLTVASSVSAAAPYDAASKAAAIESYKSSASTNADWAEESIQ